MGEKIQKSERKKIPKRKILRIKSKGNFVWARGFTIKEKVSSNFSASSINDRIATHVLRHLPSSFGDKPLMALD